MDSCSHLTVVFREAGWVCAACDEPFILRKTAKDNHERNYKLLQAAAILLSAKSDLHRGSMLHEGCHGAIDEAEQLLQMIENRNSPYASIKDSGF
jgi:hypothetical protein